MKTKRLFPALGFIGALMIISCCKDDGLEQNNSDTQVFVNTLINDSVNPGDDFYQYANGTWLKTSAVNSRYVIDDNYGSETFIEKVFERNDPMIDKLHTDFTTAAATKKAIDSTLVQKTKAQIDAINSLTSLESIIQKAAEMGMKGYSTCLRLASYPVEGKVKLVLYIQLPAKMPAEAWQLTTGCSETEAERQKAMADSITNDWNSKVGLMPRKESYDGDDIPARKMLADYAGEDPHYLVYPSGDQDDFLNYTVTDAQKETWKQILCNAVIAFNYNWTYPTAESFKNYLTSGLNPMAYRLAKQYSEIYKDDINREYVSQMVEEIRTAFIETIQENDWLSESTKAAAIAKGNALKTYIGYPDSWQEAKSGSVPTGKTLLEDMEQLGEEYLKIQKNAMTDNPTTDDIWYSLTQLESPAFITNSYNIPELNALYIYMTMHVPNFCRTNVPDSYNYGMVGTVAGHEFGHSFDSSGCLYGTDGTWQSWWTDADMAEFNKRTQKLAEYFSSYIPYPDIFPTLHCNGIQTNTEDVADLVGVDLALKAMVKHYKAKGATDAEILQAKREFFTGYGNVHVKNWSEEDITYLILYNIHSISPARVNCIVRQMDEWYDVFNVKSTDKLYLAPADRVRFYNK